METNDKTCWTITELAAEAAGVLSRESVDQSSARVSEIPSTRTIRFYTTHGLLDRPVDFRGRTALYGRRHLLQIVAIKRMQARGVALQEIQARLVGATQAELEKLAGLDARGETLGAKPRSARREDFWRGEVAQTSVDADVGEEEQEVEARAEVRDIAGIVAAVKLAGVTVVLDEAPRELWEDDLEAIRVAAEPLIKLLKSRGLVRGT